jgi:hypothetical protein
MEEEVKEKQPPIMEQLTEYAETRIKLTKYKVIEKSTSVAAGVVTDMAIVISLILTFMFASFTLALYLAEVLHSFWQGFGIVTLLYLFIGIIVMLARGSFKKPIVNALIRKIFSEN